MSLSDPHASEDESPLSAQALDALEEFYLERDVAQRDFECVKVAAQDDSLSSTTFSMDAFTENWNLSQFWYNPETAACLATEILAKPHQETTIAIVSVPSVFVEMKKMLETLDPEFRPFVRLLEYDSRFSVFKEFVYYDYQQPLKLPVELKGQFDRVIIDPPFLSHDCHSKVLMTVNWLLNASPLVPASKERPERRMAVCTGETMQETVLDLYEEYGVRETTYVPQHAAGLANEFKCFANFTCKSWELTAS